MPVEYRLLKRAFSDLVLVPAVVEELFDHLDDHRRLSAHMARRSWLLAGSRMTVFTDEGNGQRIGSHIFLDGRVLGIPLSVDEVVEEYRRPERKTWKTVGQPRLLVIGEYRMGFELASVVEGTRLRVFIEYALPEGRVTRWLGRLMGDAYARWCVRMMLADAITKFERPHENRE